MIYAVNTNVNAQLTAEKFVAAGYPLDRIVRVIGERADDTNTLPRTVRVVRITDYTPNKQTNLIVSPYGTASKIFLPKEGHDSMFQKPAGVLFVSNGLLNCFSQSPAIFFNFNTQTITTYQHLFDYNEVFFPLEVFTISNTFSFNKD